LNELCNSLEACSNTSAPGPDHLTWRHLKVLIMDDDMTRVLLSLGNSCISLGHWPSTFKELVFVIIPKPGKPCHDTPKMFCPTVLLNTIGKLFEKMLAQYMQFDAVQLGIFHSNQLGEIKQHSTEDAGIFLTHLIHAGWTKGLKTSVVAFDIAQFFPSLNHTLLVDILKRQGFPGE
jgi:hypothetical protein